MVWADLKDTFFSVIPAFVFLNKQKQSFSPEQNNSEKLKLFDGWKRYIEHLWC